MQAPIIELFSPTIGQHRVPANSAYAVSYAQASVRQGDGFTLIEQGYNARDAYLCLIEVHASAVLELSIRCSRPDLYWFYPIQGSCYLTLDQSAGLFSLDADHYTLAYVPAGTHRCRVPAGRHLLFFFMVKAEWLLRHTNGQLQAILPLVAALQNRSPSCQMLAPLPIHQQIHKHLLRLLHLPQRSGLVADAAVYSLLVDLITISLRDVAAGHTRIGNSLALVNAVRAYIDEQVRAGALPPLAEIATGFRVSIQYMGRMHKEHYGYALQKYLVVARLKEAFRLLQEERYSPSEVAYRLGYGDLSSFSRQFKQYYGIAPREVP